MSEEDKQTSLRARKIQKFLSQPMFVAETFSGIPGKYVPIDKTIDSFAQIVDGKADDIPDAAFFMAGDIEDVRAKAAALEGSE